MIYRPGDNYYVVSPQYSGYNASTEIVRGTIGEDMTVYVRYTRRANRLTIRYIHLDGTEAADNYTVYMRTGDAYEVESPEIPGYQAVRLKVSGTNGGTNEEYTVLYVPEGEYTLTSMEDYETPTGLGGTCIQIGICAE